MEIRKTSIYDSFICTADKCPENCCRGWRIHIDDDTVQKYMEMKGLEGIIIRTCVQTDDTMPYFSRRSVVCPLMTIKGLCSIQKRHGEDLMPEICRRFPRDIRNYGLFTEFHLDPACTHVCEMLLDPEVSPTLVISEDEIKQPQYGTNDDTGFLKELDRSRAGLMKLFEYSEEKDLYSLDGIFTDAMNIAFDDHDKVLNISESRRKREIKIQNLPLPAVLINEMISASFYKDEMRFYSPYFYRLFRSYFRYFGGLSPLKAQHRYEDALKKLQSDCPQVVSHIYTYIRYSLEREYLSTYEDYSFIKRILDNIICANLVLVLMTVCHMRYGRLTLSDEARIISMTERRARHNESILKKLSDMYRKDTPDFFSTDMRSP
ncbi:MAG: flagellin lysine-N-methylase [Lachnospiraceae bacterium]|nr:flagellin lysine-N-methylase [Lachnospiraceae bacterium]